jgi:hypothetical protein
MIPAVRNGIIQSLLAYFINTIQEYLRANDHAFPPVAKQHTRQDGTDLGSVEVLR